MPLALHKGLTLPPAPTPSPTSSSSAPRLLDQVRAAVRLRHYSPRTEEAYVAWIRRYVIFRGRRHPRVLGAAEAAAFLSHLAGRGASASTQNQALSALLFLYQAVMKTELPWLHELVRAQGPARLPTVLSRAEVARLLGQLHGTVWLMASLLYGGGLRLSECVELRAKYPSAPFEWGWQWVLPATRFHLDAATGERRRRHLHESVLQRAVKQAARDAGLPRPASCHTLRHHSFATHLAGGGV